MITQSYERRRRVPLAPAPTTPEFLAEQARINCRNILVYRSHEVYWKGFHRVVARNKLNRLYLEDDVIIAAKTLEKMNRSEQNLNTYPANT